MIQKLRIILFPFSLLYILITEIRNILYDKGFLKSTAFNVPIINIGNLSMGGTGKTPMIEYLIKLLQADYKIAVVSRGYKRKTKGYILANSFSTAEQIGDEPFQIFKKFEKIIVAVGENRVAAVRKVLVKFNPDVVLLDDAFQHRKIKAGMNILLTTFNKPFTEDFILPVGNLRECRKNVKRADIVIVSKSPEQINKQKKQKIIDEINKYTNKHIYFSYIQYATSIISNNNMISIEELSEYHLLLITGIAHPQPLKQYLSKKNIIFDMMKFGDHHYFTKNDIQQITDAFEKIKANKKLILTTEKDYVRLHNYFDKELYYLPIVTEIFDNKTFNNKILDYVRK